jgi:ribulose-bisphosphate carboxylase large chain
MEMLKRADYVKKQGNEYVMIDVLTAGFSAVQTLRNYTDLVIHAHRAMHGALTKNKKHGISMLCLAKLYRLMGVDQLHIGTAGVGKMDGKKKEIILIEEEIEHNDISEIDKEMILEQEWYTIKPVFAVASGGLSPLSIPDVMDAMGKNIIMQFGGGCHGHPQGTLKGAIAVRQAMDATMKGISLEEYAKDHLELRLALKKWSKPKKKVSKTKTTNKSSNKKKVVKKKTKKRR